MLWLSSMYMMDEKLKISGFVQETHDSYRLIISYSKEPLVFKPGQFVMAGLMLKDKQGKERVMSRAYSIASTPTYKDRLELVIKEVPGGFLSKELGTLRAGDELYVKGPYGNYIYEESMGNKVVLIGAGSGISPLRCILQYVVDKKLDAIEVLFIYSNKKPEDIICRKELEQYAQQHKNVKVVFTITRPEGTAWKGKTGRVDAAMLKQEIKDIAGSLYYLCGSPDFVKGVKETLLSIGAPKEKIKEEKY